MPRLVVCSVGLFFTLFAATVRAADKPAPAEAAPAQTSPAQAAPLPAPAPAGAPAPAAGYPAAPPAPYNPYPYAPSPPYGYPPPGYGYPYAPYGAALYEAQKRSPGLSLLLEFVVPGLGSIYGDHITGAIISWGVMVGGILLIVDSIDTEYCGAHESCSSPRINDGEIALGLVMLLGGRIYGFIDAYTSTKAYNVRLRENLGVPQWMSFGIKPIRGQGTVAYAPTLHLRF